MCICVVTLLIITYFIFPPAGQMARVCCGAVLESTERKLSKFIQVSGHEEE